MNAKLTIPIDNERDALNGFLDKQRAALLRRLDGLTDTQAREVPTASTLSLLAILKHSALWERRWFQNILAGHQNPEDWPAAWDDNSDDFRLDETDTLERWRASFEDETAIARELVAGLPLDTPCAWPQLAHRNLRWVLLHMIEETARHAGHADIIRETLDDRAGV